MSSWERIQHLPEQLQEQTLVLYREHIPIEVRKALSDWIDKQDWQSLNVDSLEVNNYLPVLATEFFRVLEVRKFPKPCVWERSTGYPAALRWTSLSGRLSNV